MGKKSAACPFNLTFERLDKSIQFNEIKTNEAKPRQGPGYVAGPRRASPGLYIVVLMDRFQINLSIYQAHARPSYIAGPRRAWQIFFN